MNSHVCRAGPPIDRLLDKFPTCHQGLQDTYRKTQKGGVHHFQGITEAGSRSLLRQPSSTLQSAAPCHVDLPWHRPPEALPCCPPGSRDPSLQDSEDSLAHHAVSQTCRLRLRDSGWLFLLIASYVDVIFLLDGLLYVGRILMYVNVLL